MIAPVKRLSQPEFVALIAMLFATIAFSIDSMLPALPQIALELTPENVNRAQLIITSFILGMGLGTFIAGPMSDSYGRKPVILGGVVLYVIGAVLAWRAQSLDLLLAARIIQGLGVAGPRVVSLAMVRDLYEGRQMARVMSFAFLIFTLVPAVAPAFGTVIIAAFGWRGIFACFVVFALISSAWLMLRQPETLPLQARRPLEARTLLAAFREVMGNRVVQVSTAVMTLSFGALFGTLSSTQQVFDVTFGRGESFPFWFALIALLSGGSSITNAALVERLGMRYLVRVALLAQVGISLFMGLMTWAALWPDWLYFPAYVAWTTSVFFMAGLIFGNLNALALEPVGHIAGMASSITGAVSTVLSVVIAAPLGLAFDGTPVPLIFGVFVLIGGSAALMQLMPPSTHPVSARSSPT